MFGNKDEVSHLSPTPHPQEKLKNRRKENARTGCVPFLHGPQLLSH